VGKASRVMSRAEKSDTLPLVTVVMPTLNEAHFIGRSLDAILGQDYPAHRFEVIVADSDSTDGTAEVVRTFCHRHSEPAIDLVNVSRGTPGSGLNAAIRHARGSVIVRVDAHTEVPSDYVRVCVESLQQHTVENVGGCVEPTGTTWFGNAVAIATGTFLGHGGALFRRGVTEKAVVDTVPFGAWRRQLFDHIGLFREDLPASEDAELNFRIGAIGGRILLLPDLRIKYYTRSSPLLLWRQYSVYGWAKSQVVSDNLGELRWRHVAPPAFVATNLALAPLAAFSGPARILWLALVASYGTANLLVSLVASHRHGWRYLPALPLVYAILHISYGLGFLGGLLRHWIGTTKHRLISQGSRLHQQPRAEWQNRPTSRKKGV